MGTFRCAAAAAVAVVAMTTGVDAGAATPKKCKGDQVRVFVQEKGRVLHVRARKPGRALCVRPRRATLLDNPIAPRADRRRMRRGLMGRAVRDRRAPRQLARMVAAPPARAARRKERFFEERKTVEPGVETWGDWVRISPDPDEIGSGREITTVVEMDAAKVDKRQKPGAVTIRNLEELDSSAFVKRCPTSAGRIALDYVWGVTQARSVIANGKRTVYGFSLTAKATGHAQVGDDARVATISYQADVEIKYWAHVVNESDGQLLERKPSRTFTGDFDAANVPLKGGAGAATGRWRTGRHNVGAADQAHMAAVAQAEANGLVHRFRPLLERAEQVFFWERDCAEFVYLPESGNDFETGGTEKLVVEVRALADGKPVEGGVVDTDACSHVALTPEKASLPGAAFTLTDPAREWTDDAPPCLQLEATTRAGRPDRGRFEWTRRKPEPPGFPWRYEVLDASLQETSTGSRLNGYCDDFGPTTGSVRFGGAFAHGSESTVDRRADGSLSGQLAGRVHARWTDHQLKGCRSTDAGLTACQVTMPDRAPGGDGTWAVRASVSAASESAQTAQLAWTVNNPTLGFADAGDDECNVDIVGFIPRERTLQEVPMARLAATGPQTFEFSDSVRLDKHMDGEPASIEHAWTLRLTVRRVDAQGRPL